MTAIGSRVVIVRGIPPEGGTRSATLAIPPGVPRDLGDALALAWGEEVLRLKRPTLDRPAAGVQFGDIASIPDEHLLARMLDAWQRARLEVPR